MVVIDPKELISSIYTRMAPPLTGAALEAARARMIAAGPIVEFPLKSPPPGWMPTEAEVQAQLPHGTPAATSTLQDTVSKWLQAQTIPGVPNTLLILGAGLLGIYFYSKRH